MFCRFNLYSFVGSSLLLLCHCKKSKCKRIPRTRDFIFSGIDGTYYSKVTSSGTGDCGKDLTRCGVVRSDQTGRRELVSPSILSLYSGSTGS